MHRPFLNALHLAALALMTLVGLGFGHLSPGLASATAQGPFHCRDLLSSGGDDDAMMIAFALFALPLLSRLMWLRHPASRWEIALFAVCAAASLLALWLASLDCAEVLYTAFVLPDPVLATALLALPVALATLLALRRSA